MKRILITGGAGFIGSALTRHLAESGTYEITVMDNLSSQVHGEAAIFPVDLQQSARCVQGDVRNREDLSEVLRGQEIVVHLAAETGTGQSMYEIFRYTSTNIDGTALLLEECGKLEGGLRKLVVASSRAIYGEGKYHCDTCGVVYPESRRTEDMKNGDFEVHCPKCGRPAEPLPTDEDSLIRPGSVYGSTKSSQEELVTIWGRAHDVPTVALRFQNVYGPGQALGNPYTGILSIFSNMILGGRAIDIYEDGKESRDFVYIEDVVKAIRSTIEVGMLPRRVYNVGTGTAVSVAEVAELLMEIHGERVPATVSGHFRTGDIRHNFAAMGELRKDLGFSPLWGLKAGLEQLIHWVRSVESKVPNLQKAETELETRGLLHRAKGWNSE